MTSIEVSRLMIYPVKSATGIEVKSARCTKEGIKYPDEPALEDRRWGVAHIKEDGKMVVLSGRICPRMVLVRPHVTGRVLTLDAPGMPTLDVPMDGHSNESNIVIPVTEFQHETIEYVDCGEAAADWFCKFLEKPGMRLIYNAPGMMQRKLDEREIDGRRHDYNTSGNEVAFQDLCPVLIVSQPSVDDLNKRVDDPPISPINFRPSIIVSGCDAYAEDTWEKVQVGNEASLIGSWIFPRCFFTTADPDTGIRRQDKQPLAALRTYRMPDPPTVHKDFKGLPNFGKYFQVEKEGIINVGDKIVVM